MQQEGNWIITGFCVALLPLLPKTAGVDRSSCRPERPVAGWKPADWNTCSKSDMRFMESLWEFWLKVPLNLVLLFFQLKSKKVMLCYICCFLNFRRWAVWKICCVWMYLKTKSKDFQRNWVVCCHSQTYWFPRTSSMLSQKASVSFPIWSHFICLLDFFFIIILIFQLFHTLLQ